MQSPPGCTTPKAVTRALRNRSAGGDLVAVDQEPERQLHRRRRESPALGDRLELEARLRERPIVQSPEEQQGPDQEPSPESLEQAWVIIDEVVKAALDQVESKEIKGHRPGGSGDSRRGRVVQRDVGRQ